MEGYTHGAVTEFPPPRKDGSTCASWETGEHSIDGTAGHGGVHLVSRKTMTCYSFALMGKAAQAPAPRVYYFHPSPVNSLIPVMPCLSPLTELKWN